MGNYLTLSFVYCAIVFVVAMVILWLFCRLFRINRPGIPVLGAAMITLLLAPFDPVILAVVVVPFILGIRVGRSTQVPLDPTDTFSPRVKISDEEYAYRMRQLREMVMSPRGQMFFSAPHVSPTDKLSLLFENDTLYPHARGIATLFSVFFCAILHSVVYGGQAGGLFLLFMLSFPYGYSIGMLWKYMKGNRIHPQLGMNGTTYRPTLLSFIGSLGYCCITLVTALTMTYFFYDKSPTLITVLDCVSGLFFIFTLFAAIIAHTNVITFFEEGIYQCNVLSKRGLEWSLIEKAEIRERKNFVSKTDRIVTFRLKDGYPMSFPTSVYLRQDENEIIEKIRRRMPTSTKFDRPTF